ncbi:PilW family protein [Kangiella sp. HZ709]|uniref:PilW family protein n=1 Tax=Kangiella sp. HZ709 TaxID=2666328 RepID=UPI0012B15117|nr:PilW family protein [Kangiella sp. HZ709]MRX27098.1 hypothetical protein [Kangiella sp. HZ709]
MKITDAKSLPNIKSQQGFTLVELMVGGLLGLLLIAAAATVYLSSTQTNRTSQGLLNAKSDVQLALGLLKDDIAKAGWANNNSSAYTLSSPFPATITTLDGGAGSDSISLQYESCDNSDLDNGCSTTGVDSADCNGTAVAGGSIITNTYSVNGSKELVCNNQPIISNVENFQVLYGQVTSSGIEYVTASNITDRSRVHSVRFGMIVSSDINTSSNDTSRTIELLDKTVTSNDKRVRLKYESTVVVLNKPFTSNFGI